MTTADTHAALVRGQDRALRHLDVIVTVTMAAAVVMAATDAEETTDFITPIAIGKGTTTGVDQEIDTETTTTTTVDANVTLGTIMMVIDTAVGK